VKVVAKRGSQQVYNTILKSKDWLIINYIINVKAGFLLGFYIFKGERIKENYIKHCNARSCMVT
jgi:hypothetical protein